MESRENMMPKKSSGEFSNPKSISYFLSYSSAKKHPKVRSGEKDESEVFEKFCRVLEMKNNEIRFSKFFEFFLGLSLTIERNDVFINLMQTLFGV